MKQLLIELEQEELVSICGGEVRWVLHNGQWVPINTESN